MASEPVPQFFGDATEDPLIGGLMATIEASAMTVVPIVARGTFLGAFSVSVTERPERLRSDGELMERLSGVAALAAPALQNGQLVDTLRHGASHDGLTGVLNRIGFAQRIESVLHAAGNDQAQVGLLFVDLDEFKQINDRHGHEAGDQLIRQAAERLSASARDEAAVARLGGDEFAVILADVGQDDQVRAAEARVRSAFAEPFMLGEVPVSLGASVGGGVWPEHGHTANELVKHADAAMYRDKTRRRRSHPRRRRRQHA